MTDRTPNYVPFKTRSGGHVPKVSVVMLHQRCKIKLTTGPNRKLLETNKAKKRKTTLLNKTRPYTNCR